MPTKKVTLTLPAELAERIREGAAEDGLPVARDIARALEPVLRKRAGRALIAEWQAEHGALTSDEIAAANAEMATADAEALR